MTRRVFIDSISALDARTDRNIKKYFVETQSIRTVQSSPEPSFAIVGLKGAGKTTLYRCLAEGWNQSFLQTTVGLSTESAAFEAHFETINCLQFEKSVRVGMMLFILRQIDEHTAKFARTDKLSSWIARKDKLLQTRQKLTGALKRLEGLAILGVGLNWSSREPGNVFNPIKLEEAKELQELLRDFEHVGQKLKIVIDDPDRLFTKGTSFDPHLLAGYILGTDWIAREFSYVKFLHVLKSSVYDMLWDVEEMANLPHDYFLYIGWSEGELRQLVETRLSFSGISASEIFEDPMDLAIATIVSRIRNGPRDLLRFMEIILKSSATARISLKSIDEQEANFKREARRQMESVYAGVYDGLDAFVDVAFSGGETIAVSEFKNRFDILRMESRPAGLDYSQPWLRRADRTLRALVDAGAVDVNSNGSWIRPFEVDYFRFNTRDAGALLRKNAVLQ